VNRTFAAFAVSITEPPPTARKLSAPAPFAASAQLATTSVSESCGTESNTPATSRPPSVIPADTAPTRPVSRITSSVTIRGRSAPSMANSNPVLSIRFTPEMTRVGQANW